MNTAVLHPQRPDARPARPRPRAPPSESPPSRRYARRRRLRASIFGDVVAAEDLARGGARVVAKRSLMPLLRRGVSTTNQAVEEDPLREARLLRELPTHPNLVRYVAEHADTIELVPGERSTAAQRHWLVLERVDGPELFDVVDATAGRGLPADRARRLFLGMARAVHHLHQHRVAHLDVSLENTLVSGDGEAVLCDLGLARRAGEAAAAAPPQGEEQARPGKTLYMAPEIFARVAGYDPMAADVWSLGVSLFMMVAGSPPFEEPRTDDRRVALLLGGQAATLVRAWGLEDRFPSDLLDLLSSMLREPSERATVDEVLASPWLSECD